MARGIRRDRVVARPYEVMFGYISIPINVDRDKFIQRCCITERVNVWMADNVTIIKDCYIDREVLQDIDFPESFDKKGSFVVMVTHPINGKATVISRISKEYESQLVEPFKWKKVKTNGENLASFVLDGKDGNVFVNVNSNSSNSGIRFSVLNKQKNGILELNCDGNIKLSATGDIDLKTSKNIKINKVTYNSKGEEIISSFVIDDNGVTIDSETIVVGGSEHPASRADILQKECDKLQSKLDLVISAIKTAVPVAGDGGLSYQQQMKVILEAAMDADFSEIASDKVFIS